MPEDERRRRREIDKHLDASGWDIDAAERLLQRPVNPFAAYHLQQAAEKLVKAVRSARGLLITSDHDLTVLLDGRADGRPPAPLAPDDPWRARLRPLEPLSMYATAFRYDLKAPIDAERWSEALVSLKALHAFAKTDLV